MYEVILNNGKWWISKDGRILEELGEFIDPISPLVIIEEIQDEV